MNIQLLALYENCCQQPLEFLEKAIKRRSDPFENENCRFYNTGECRSDYFCRQLVKKVVVGSWFPNALAAKRWMSPGTACYAKKVDTGGIIIIEDPKPFKGDWKKNQKKGLVFITKKDIYCSNCARRRALEKIGVCEACLPLFPSLSEILEPREAKAA
jgi:hypothetical protein